MTKEDKILAILDKLKLGQVGLSNSLVKLELQFSNHLDHHRQDTIREVNCLRRWIWASIPTIAILVIAVVTAAYYLGKS